MPENFEEFNQSNSEEVLPTEDSETSALFKKIESGTILTAEEYAAVFDCEPEQIVSDIKKLDDKTVVFIGNINLEDMGVVEVPTKLRLVTGNVLFPSFDKSKKTENTRELEIVGGDLSIGFCAIKEIKKLKEVLGSFGIYGCSKLKSLGPVKRIGKNARFKNAGGLEDLGQLEEVGGSIDLEATGVKTLGQLKRIGGSAIFHTSSVENLGQLETIGADLRFTSRLENLGRLQSVGRNVFIPKDSKLDFSSIKIGGEIKK